MEALVHSLSMFHQHMNLNKMIEPNLFNLEIIALKPFFCYCQEAHSSPRTHSFKKLSLVAEVEFVITLPIRHHSGVSLESAEN